jgi:hypothetical protein
MLPEYSSACHRDPTHRTASNEARRRAAGVLARELSTLVCLLYYCSILLHVALVKTYPSIHGEWRIRTDEADAAHGLTMSRYDAAYVRNRHGMIRRICGYPYP